MRGARVQYQNPMISYCKTAPDQICRRAPNGRPRQSISRQKSAGRRQIRSGARLRAAEPPACKVIPDFGTVSLLEFPTHTPDIYRAGYSPFAIIQLTKEAASRKETAFVLPFGFACLGVTAMQCEARRRPSEKRSFEGAEGESPSPKGASAAASAAQAHKQRTPRLPEAFFVALLGLLD